MGAYYDEIEIEDMSWDEAKGVYHYPCPCGDRFEISRKQLANYEDIATCPSCSLIIRVIYDPVRTLSSSVAYLGVNLSSSLCYQQLDFEDEPPDDESQQEESEKEDESDSHSDDDRFEDALDKLTLHEDSKPAMIAVST
ncbi:zf-CSL-domain-containing protein [Chiua virens]|nr:zf-CSL-domain-containing protein [Chiua virens]